MQFTFETGTKEERPGTRWCNTCSLFVAPGECGTTREHVESFAAATCAFPCTFPSLQSPEQAANKAAAGEREQGA